MKKSLLISLLLSLLLVAPVASSNFFASAKEKVVQVRLSTHLNEDHFLAQKMTWIANELEKRSKGRFKCKVFYGGEAGGEKEELEDLLLGNLEIMNQAGSYYYLFVPQCNVIELPGCGWKSRKEALKVIRGYWNKLSAVSAEKGFYPVSLDIVEFFVAWNKTPFKTLAEIKGKKERSVNADLWINVTKDIFGGVPVPMPYSEAYLAFKTGVCDGCSAGPFTAGITSNWQEVLKCVMDTRFILSHTFTLTSAKWLKQLSPDLRKIVLQVGKDAETFNLKLAEERTAENIRKLKAAGGVFVPYDEITKADQEYLLEKALPFREAYMKGLGKDAYNFYLDFSKYFEKATGRKLH
jgi:TRAP-type C4-dicarboxylate transport system substrate-binding protein